MNNHVRAYFCIAGSVSSEGIPSGGMLGQRVSVFEVWLGTDKILSRIVPLCIPTSGVGMSVSL